MKKIHPIKTEIVGEEGWYVCHIHKNRIGRTEFFVGHDHQTYYKRSIEINNEDINWNNPLTTEQIRWIVAKE